MRRNYVLGLLFVINLVNYLDRQILYALLPLIKEELSVSDTLLGGLASAFMLVYMCAAPPIGYWADRSLRKNWIAYGIGLWSLATLLSGLSRSYAQLFAARAAVGIGESCYGSVSPSFIAEHFPKERRGGVLALFSMAIPLGSALGYLLGGWVGHHYGWRHAFFIAGIPGLLLALLAYHLKDPRDAQVQRPQPPKAREYLSLYKNRSYVASTLAMAAMTFALGGLAVWMPSYFTRFLGLNISQAGLVFGGITAIAGIFGTLLGGWLGDKLLAYTEKSYFLVSGIGLLLAFPLGCLTLLCPSLPWALAALFITETLAFLNMGPLNAVIVWVTASSMRNVAFAANIFVIHALGDALSPTWIGVLSDLYGLKPALIAAMAFLTVAGFFCLWGARHIETDSRSIEHETA